MAGSSATLATSSDPPWPPDLCVVNRFSDLQSGTHVFGSILHPEVPSDSVAAPHKETLSPGVAAESSSNTSNQGRPPLRKSNSLPTLNLPSLPSKSAGHLAWIPVGRKTSPRRSPPRSSSSDSVKILSSSQFDSEEELISAAQQIIRKRMEAEDADFPPFSTAKERKKLSRMKQRQAMVQLCESPVAIAGSTASILQENSNTQMVISVEPSILLIPTRKIKPCCLAIRN
ncbi:hypothetical protein HID58_044896 [Brassica napus]|uniref:Uncharacterized protein n=1 Tax=Brassica napus TaxID=3708 RepID=A0ABQ8ASW7_BRANA|nr:hypothetical protein HID58_044896 [Brassica napus]